LRDVITSQEARFWKFLSKSVYLNKGRVELDKRLLKSYYKNKGYYEVNIISSNVEYSEGEGFILTYSINEGSKYYINEAKLILPDSYDKNNFSKIIQTLEKLKNKKYSLIKLSKIINALDKITLLKQYEFISASIEKKLLITTR